jgi:hypothetical protein
MISQYLIGGMMPNRAIPVQGDADYDRDHSDMAKESFCEIDESVVGVAQSSW